MSRHSSNNVMKIIFKLSNRFYLSDTIKSQNLDKLEWKTHETEIDSCLEIDLVLLLTGRSAKIK